MGCDGGTIPKRDELVRQKKKPEEKDKDSERSFKWRHCAITQQPLQKPIVSCQLGRLYSKMSVIEALLDKSKMPQHASHIKSLKDVKEINLTENPIYADKAKTNEACDDIAPYICPIVGLEMSGKFRFVVIWSCGCVISERAYKEVSATNCHKCLKAFTPDDVIVLNGTEKDSAVSFVKMQDRKAKAKAEKKSKKACVPVVAEGIECNKPSSSTHLEEGVTENDKKSKDQGNSSNVVAGTSLPSKGKREAAALDILDPKFKKTRTDYSVANDPNASAVYKSLFTSHQSAIKKDKAHWVTYNPFYN